MAMVDMGLRTLDTFWELALEPWRVRSWSEVRGLVRLDIRWGMDEGIKVLSCDGGDCAMKDSRFFSPVMRAEMIVSHLNVVFD